MESCSISVLTLSALLWYFLSSRSNYILPGWPGTMSFTLASTSQSSTCLYLLSAGIKSEGPGMAFILKQKLKSEIH